MTPEEVTPEEITKQDIETIGDAIQNVVEQKTEAEMEQEIYNEQMRYFADAMSPIEIKDLSEVIDYTSIRKENLIKYQTQKTFDYMDSMIKAFIVLPDSIKLNQEIVLDLQSQLENMELLEDEKLARLNGVSATIKQIMSFKEEIESRIEKAKTHNSMLLMIEKIIEGSKI